MRRAPRSLREWICQSCEKSKQVFVGFIWLDWRDAGRRTDVAVPLPSLCMQRGGKGPNRISAADGAAGSTFSHICVLPAGPRPGPTPWLHFPAVVLRINPVPGLRDGQCPVPGSSLEPGRILSSSLHLQTNPLCPAAPPLWGLHVSRGEGRGIFRPGNSLGSLWTAEG